MVGRGLLVGDDVGDVVGLVVEVMLVVGDGEGLGEVVVGVGDGEAEVDVGEGVGEGLVEVGVGDGSSPGTTTMTPVIWAWTAQTQSKVRALVKVKE